MAHNSSGSTFEIEATQSASTLRLPVRLVVCVDGTWFGPDGIHPDSGGNISNIFRIYCCIKEGEVTDDKGDVWQQEKAYIKGIDNSTSWPGKLLSGAFGIGIEQQIKNVYQLCCERARHPEDEIFFFGFSRGAFVVRAVANLLSYMRIVGVENDVSSFDHAYKQMLELYRDVRSGMNKRRGSIYEYMSKCRPPPKLQYLGCIDTVKAFDDEGLYEIGIHPSHRHCRQALAMNEVKSAFTPELWAVAEKTAEYELRRASSLHSLLEAWFLGSHGNLGGGNAQDGYALYPAQWLLSEARDLGLVLEFTTVTYTSSIFRNEVAIDNPLDLLFPIPHETLEKAVPHTLVLTNGIQVKMWDMKEVHERKGFDLRISQRQINWLAHSTPRKIFEQDQLAGYHQRAPLGVFIHPSAYMVYDLRFEVDTSVQSLSFLDQTNDFRQKVLPEEQIFWEQHPALGVQIDKTKFRVLVCGNAGVGKSTLINLLLGVPNLTLESEAQHGVHDIEQGFSPDGAKYIVHDSCGFQTGQQEEIDKVKNFLRRRSSSSEFAERLHAILYCISSTRTRTTESADEQFFETLKECDSNVPVVAISTRVDELEAICADRVEKDYMTQNDKKSRRQLATSDWDEIETKTKLAVEERKSKLTEDLTRCFLTKSTENKETILEVVKVLTNSLTDDILRMMFVAAQICSVQPKIEFAIARSISLYKHAVRTAAIPVAFSGLMASTAVTALIVKEVLKVFQFSGYSGDIATRIISTTLVGNYESNGIYVAANIISAVATGAMHTGVGAIAGVTLRAGSYGLKLGAIPQFGRLLLMCTVDTILIMETVFWQCGVRTPKAQDINKACALYEGKMNQVQADVKTVLPVWDVWNAFQFEKLSLELSKIIDRYRYFKEPRHDQSPETSNAALPRSIMEMSPKQNKERADSTPERASWTAETSSTNGVDSVRTTGSSPKGVTTYQESKPQEDTSHGEKEGLNT